MPFVLIFHILSL